MAMGIHGWWGCSFCWRNRPINHIPIQKFELIGPYSPTDFIDCLSHGLHKNNEQWDPNPLGYRVINHIPIQKFKLIGLSRASPDDRAGHMGYTKTKRDRNPLWHHVINHISTQKLIGGRPWVFSTNMREENMTLAVGWNTWFVWTIISHSVLLFSSFYIELHS